jgi:hypothetical protein
MTMVYHPQANGMVERAHRQLKDALRARLSSSEWTSHLPLVLLSLRAASKEDSGVSSAELVMGSPLALPLQFLSEAEPPICHFLEKLRFGCPPLPTRPLSYSQVMASVPAILFAAQFSYVRCGGSLPPFSP